MDKITLMLGDDGYGSPIPHPTYASLDEAIEYANITYPPNKSDCTLVVFRYQNCFCVYGHFEKRYIASCIPDGAVIVLTADARRELVDGRWIWSHDKWNVGALMPSQF